MRVDPRLVQRASHFFVNYWRRRKNSAVARATAMLSRGQIKFERARRVKIGSRPLWPMVMLRDRGRNFNCGDEHAPLCLNPAFIKRAGAFAIQMRAVLKAQHRNEYLLLLGACKAADKESIMPECWEMMMYWNAGTRTSLFVARMRCHECGCFGPKCKLRRLYFHCRISSSRHTELMRTEKSCSLAESYSQQQSSWNLCLFCFKCN